MLREFDLARVARIRLAVHEDLHRLARPRLRTRDVAPARALDGSAVDPQGLAAAAAALQTAGDLLGRLAANTSGHGVGLRGGRFTVHGTGAGGAVHAELDQVRWTADLAVSGTVDFRPGADDGEARLSFTGADGVAGELVASWPAGGPEARAHLTGAVAGRTLVAEMPAP